MVNKEPIVKITKYPGNSTEMQFNKAAIDIMNCPKELVVHLIQNGIKVRIPSIDDNKVYKLDRDNAISIDLDEYYHGNYDFYRVNEDEFLLTKKE